MIRPLTLLGVIVVGIAVFSFLLVPGWRNSPLSLGVLVICLVIGAYAIIKDSLDLWKDIKSKSESANQNQEKGDDPDS